MCFLFFSMLEAEKEKVTHLFCHPWDVDPDLPKPSNPVMFNVSNVCARAVLKKQSAVRIPMSIPKPQPIMVSPDVLDDYHTFSVFIKTSARSLDVSQNVIYFTDVDDEQRFIYDIKCVWEAIKEKSEITFLVITLNNDLACRLVTWEIVSEVVKSDLIPPDPSSKKQSIASIQAASLVERRNRAVEIMSQEMEMDFAGPVYRRNCDDIVSSITVWKRYIPLFLSLNSLLYTIDNQFLQIGRTIPIEEEIVKEICTKVLEHHSTED